MPEPRECVPNFKAGPEPCQCGCGKVGVPAKHGHARNCDVAKCRSCRGRRNRRRGLAKQTKAARGMGLLRSTISPGNEEQFQGPIRCEVKSGGKAGPVYTAWRWAKEQSEAARPVGDNRPFVAAFAPAGTSEVFYVIAGRELEAAVFGMGEAFGYWESA